MLYDIFIDRDRNSGAEPRYFVDHDPSVSAELVKHLRRFVLRSKVKVDDISADYAVSAVWPPNKPEDASLPITRDERTPSIGWRAVHARSDPAWAADQLSDRLGAEAVDERAYKVHRILQGVPEGPDDFVAGSTIPLEANLDYTGAVDFRKGCYVGQELTARTHHTGVTRKRILPGRFFREDEEVPTSLLPSTWPQPIASSSTLGDAPAPHTDVRPSATTSAVTRPRPSGKTGSVIAIADAAAPDASPVLVGLALLRLEQTDAMVETGGTFNVGAPGSSTWRFRAFRPSWWDEAIANGRGKAWRSEAPAA